MQRFGIPASSATVRSAMGALERRGLLHQPHTSAGRVPSPMGYRHYVDALLPEPGVAVQHLERELTGLSLRWAGLDDLLMHLARRLTDFTGLMSLITQPQQENQQLETIRLVPSGDRLLVMLWKPMAAPATSTCVCPTVLKPNSPQWNSGRQPSSSRAT